MCAKGVCSWLDEDYCTLASTNLIPTNPTSNVYSGDRKLKAFPSNCSSYIHHEKPFGNKNIVHDLIIILKDD